MVRITAAMVLAVLAAPATQAFLPVPAAPAHRYDMIGDQSFSWHLLSSSILHPLHNCALLFNLFTTVPSNCLISFIDRDVSMSAANSNGDAWNAVQKLSFLPLALVGMTGVGMAEPAFADGSISPATVNRASAIYGPRIIGLKSAVESGDIATVAAEKNAFVLYNSGAFALNKPLQKEVQAAYADVSSN